MQEIMLNIRPHSVKGTFELQIVPNSHTFIIIGFCNLSTSINVNISTTETVTFETPLSIAFSVKYFIADDPGLIYKKVDMP